MRTFLFFLALTAAVLQSPVAVGQTVAERIKLAQQYEGAGEYDKAIDVYKGLYEENPSSGTYYKYYFNALLAQQDYKEIEKLVDKQIKRNPGNLTYYVDLGSMYVRKGEEAKAEEQYRKAISKTGTEKAPYVQLANAFLVIDENELAIETYEKGVKDAREYSFSNELANLYYRSGDYKKSINLYINYLLEEPAKFTTVCAALERITVDDAGHLLLQEILYERIQQRDDPLYIELLIWDMIQQKDYNAAFIQVKALDKRLRENGQRVLDLAETALNEKAWDAAISCYQYVIDKGSNNALYYQARNGLLNCRQRKIAETNVYTETDLLSLREDYLNFLNDYNRADYRAAYVTSELAKLEAFYLFQVESAINRLNPIMNWQRLAPAQLAEFKLVLGDLYLIAGDVWESTLLYSQVDKAMKDEPLGEDARFRNARLAYYRGDFALAQGQLDVLKAATSELVANDALKLSVFITENLGLDSVAEPMELFSDAELLFFQNKNAEAMLRLEQLEKLYPAHPLLDDNYFLRFRIAMKLQQPEQAATYLEYIRENQTMGLLADDALFILGELYEGQLNQKDKASLCYEQLILNYKDSVFATEARKRYRLLRGDVIN
jgi:tetratricopeptide (TPR) repeat protein